MHIWRTEAHPAACVCTWVYLIVNVAVGEHGIEVVYALMGVPVVAIFQTFLDSAHIHGGLDDLIVVLEPGRKWRVQLVHVPVSRGVSQVSMNPRIPNPTWAPYG